MSDTYESAQAAVFASQAEPAHAMVDLETLGKKPFCPILAIGAVAFKMDLTTELNDVFYQTVDLQSCIDVGLRIDGSTLKWWMEQSKEARDAAFLDPQACALPQALDLFTNWLDSRPLQLWGNSARFDLGILEAAYHACGKETPWHFRFERCYRTINSLPDARALPRTNFGTAHNALHDAVAQAMHLRLLNQTLNLHL